MKRTSKGASAPAVPSLKLATVTPISKLSARPNANAVKCIAELKRLLKEAERGELGGIAYVALSQDHQGQICGWDYEIVGLAESDSLNLISMLEVLKQKALRTWEQT